MDMESPLLTFVQVQTLMWRSFHFDRLLNDEFWMFEFEFTQNYLFELRHPYNTLKTPKNHSLFMFKKNIAITNIQNSTLNSSFDAMSKWHDPDTRQFLTKTAIVRDMD